MRRTAPPAFFAFPGAQSDKVGHLAIPNRLRLIDVGLLIHTPIRLQACDLIAFVATDSNLCKTDWGMGMADQSSAYDDVQILPRDRKYATIAITIPTEWNKYACRQNAQVSRPISPDLLQIAPSRLMVTIPRRLFAIPISRRLRRIPGGIVNRRCKTRAR